MIGITPYILTTQRHNQYQFQMYQASLKAPVYPLSSYSFHSLYMKQQNWSLETSASLTKMMTEAASLRKEAEPFNASQSKNPLNVRTVTTSNQQAVAAAAQPKADLTNYKVEVTKLAKNQKNSGLQLSSSAASSLEGTQSFRLNVGGKEQTVSFYAFKGEANHQMLSRMAQAINREEYGVTAQVIEDKENATSRLELSSNQTGVKHSFSIYDIEGTSVQTTGAGQVSQTAEDAVYKVNDKTYTSDSNKVVIGDKKDVFLELKEVTSEAVSLSVLPNRSQIIEKVKSLLEQFNRLEALFDSTSLPHSTDFCRSLQKISSEARAQLESLGIQQMSDRSLTLDEQKFSEKLDKQLQQVQSAISGPGGFAAKLAKLAERVEQTPVINMYQSETSRYNPYNHYSLPNLFLQQASATGLYLNTIY